MKLYEVLPSVQNTYKSIEISIACAYYQDKWINLMTSVIFSYEEDTLLNKQISENKQLRNLSSGQKFRICKKSLPYKQLDELSNGFLTGAIDVNGITVNYDPIDIKNSDTSFSEHDFTSDERWGEFSVYRSRKQNTPYYTSQVTDSLKSDLITFGFEDISEAMNLLVNRGRRPDSASDFIIRAPLFAKIEEISLEENKIKITIKYHKNLNDLILQYKKYHTRENTGFLYNDSSQVGTEPYTQTMGVSVEYENITTWEIESEEIDISNHSYENDGREIVLYFKPLGYRISHARKSLDEMISERYLFVNNPLAKIFLKFCPLNQLNQILSNPINVKKDGFNLGSSDNFERAVQWLFTLYGFQTIWLGKDFEELKNVEGRVDGSVDLLCYNEQQKALAVVSCKTTTPDETHMDSIKNLAKRFEKEMKEMSIEVIPVIVSSKEANATREKCTANGIKIIDLNDMKKILDEIEKRPKPDLLLKIQTSSTSSLFSIHPSFY